MSAEEKLESNLANVENNSLNSDEILTEETNKSESKVVLNESFKLNEKIDFLGQKRILIDTNSSKSVLQLARKNRVVHEYYKELLKNDYILYFHQGTISKFYKRQFVHELFKRKDLIKYKDVYYTLDHPEGRKINDKVDKKLIVIFTCMPNKEDYDSPLMPRRMFPKFFNGIERSLVKHVYTMRIMDLNTSHGSHYISTTNFPTYEEEIQEAILKVQEELGIEKQNIVFYGGSKGGTGVIFHGAAMNVKTLAVDPILSTGGKLEFNDRRFLKGLRRADLIPDINENLNKTNEFKKFVICSENSEPYFEVTNTIDQGKVTLLNMQDDNIKTHPDVSRNSVPEQLAILNNLRTGNLW